MQLLIGRLLLCSSHRPFLSSALLQPAGCAGRCMSLEAEAPRSPRGLLAHCSACSSSVSVPSEPAAGCSPVSQATAQGRPWEMEAGGAQGACGSTDRGSPPSLLHGALWSSGEACKQIPS